MEVPTRSEEFFDQGFVEILDLCCSNTNTLYTRAGLRIIAEVDRSDVHRGASLLKYLNFSRENAFI